MPTAPSPVLAAARYVAPPVEEEGAAQLIELLALAAPEVAARNADRLAAEHDRPRGGEDDAPGAANDEPGADDGSSEPVQSLIGASHA